MSGRGPVFESSDPLLGLLLQQRRVACDVPLTVAFDLRDTPIERRNEFAQLLDELPSTLTFFREVHPSFRRHFRLPGFLAPHHLVCAVSA